MYRPLAILVVGFALVVAACGATATDAAVSSTTATTPASTTLSPDPAVVSSTTLPPEVSFPATVVGDGGELVIPVRPEAVVSLSPTATEMLFAIGAGDQVLATDSLSDHPVEAPTTSLSAFEPNVEAIAEFGPDLVVLSFDPGDVVASLTALGIPTLVQGAVPTIDGSYEQMRQLGIATGNASGAADTIGQMQSDIAAIVASVPSREEPTRYYHELDNTYYSAASSTFIGEVYGLLGMESIADGAADLNFGYPQLSAEFILEADPDVILLADIKCCAQDAASVAQRPGWGQLSAVTSGAIVELDDDIASRWGPRVVDLLARVAAALIEFDESP